MERAPSPNSQEKAGVPEHWLAFAAAWKATGEPVWPMEGTVAEQVIVHVPPDRRSIVNTFE